MDYNELLSNYNKLREENKKLKIEIARLKGLVEKDKIEDPSTSNVPNVNANIITKNSSNEEKVNLYLSLFNGMVIVDEFHHVSATNFNKILSETRAKYVYGLTATPIRKDGYHPIIFMQCGPIRYKVDAKKEAKKRNFEHYIIPR